MRSPPKYLFDSDFAAAPAGKPTTIGLVEHAAKLKEAEAAAYARGHAAAEASAKVEADRRVAAALERMAAAFEGHTRTLATVEAQLETEAVAVAVARKLAPQLVAREPFAEISALATECFRHLVATPHVVVRVNHDLHGIAREKLDEIARARGLDSRLVVIVEPDIASGDCRIEWADGGVVRDSAATAAAIDESVARYINARRASTS